MFNLSIIIPVRRNCPWLKYFLDSFFINTNNHENVELLLGIAHDDTLGIIEGFNIKNIRLDQRKRKFGVPEYTNHLALASTGKLVWWLSDECIIKTKGYDELLTEYANKYTDKIYKFSPNGIDGGGWAYPILTKKWIEKTGKFADHVSIDSWLSTIGGYLPPERSITIDNLVIEDRRVTGKINYEESHKSVLPPEVPYTVLEWGGKEVMEKCKKEADILLKAIIEGL